MFMPMIRSSLCMHPSPLALLLLFENTNAIKVTKGYVVLLGEVIIAVQSLLFYNAVPNIYHRTSKKKKSHKLYVVCRM